jgi:hypothetical protein
MKLHALALCLAGTMAICIPAAADEYRSTVAGERVTITREGAKAPNGTYYAEERVYFLGNLYPDLEPLDVVASKVSEIVHKQHTEVAHLSAMMPAAQTAGFTNIVTVYDAMAADHSRLAAFGSEWLMKHGYPVPSPPAAVSVDFAPAAGVDHMIDMHVSAFDEAIARRRTEKSSTVRGMLLWAAATTNMHISWLRTLDSDVERGRRTLSARLESALTGKYSDVVVERMITEEREYFASIQQTPPVVLEQVVEIPTERIVTVEKVVEVPVERIVERVVEKPVIVERVVEKVVYRDRPVSRVAGQRQSIRRPAK